MMKNDTNDRKSISAADIAEETHPQFMSVGVCQRPLEHFEAAHQRPLQSLKSTSNTSEVEKKLEYRSMWINGYIPGSSVEFRRSRTSFEVSDTNSMTIAKRIFDSNKNRSIYAVCDDEAIMRCKTPSHIIFTVRLVRLSQKVNTILIDVRRRKGCPMLFRDEFQALFHAAVHGEITPLTSLRNIKYQSALNNSQIAYIPLEESDIDLSLRAASVDIESKMYDACVITLQDLSVTTDPQSKETSQIACKLILDKYWTIFEYIIDDIRKEVDYSCGNRNNYNSQEYMRSLTLGLLGNILTVIPKHSALISLIQDTKKVTSVIKSLQLYLQMAEECPINASLATKCLRLLAQTDYIFMIDTDTNMALENARKFGKLSYQNLEREAQAALIAIKV